MYSLAEDLFYATRGNKKGLAGENRLGPGQPGRTTERNGGWGAKGQHTKRTESYLPYPFKAFQGVTFKVLSEKDGWLEVMHENGDQGWVLKSMTWGQ
jgi:Bacterial SH3 domain